jgi:hypothetical protein
MKKILSAKDWQLFILIVICGAWISPSLLREFINSVAAVTFSLWIYAVGVYGQYRITELGLKMLNVKLFKANVIFIAAFWLIVLIYFSMHGHISDVNKPTNTFQPIIIILNVAFLYLIFAVFQTIIFACKTIAKIELRREVSFGDYFTNLLLMAFLFIGIWILQPKISRLIGTGTSNRKPLNI